MTYKYAQYGKKRFYGRRSGARKRYKSSSGAMSSSVPARYRRAVMIRPAQVGFVRRAGSYGRYSGSRPEMKFFDSDVADNPVGATLTINLLTTIPEGNGESERIGRKITLRQASILYHMNLPAATAAGSTATTVRCMLIQDTQTNGAAFVAADLLDTDVLSSFNNLANSSRFKIIYKEEFVLSAGGAAASGAAFVFSEDQAYLRKTLKLNIPMEFDNSATTGVITSIRSNNLYWCTQADAALCVATGQIRLRYSDR